MNEKETPLSSLGAYGLIEQVGATFQPLANGGGGNWDDAATHTGDSPVLFGSTLLLEGIHFDLTYTPLQHLGYKAAVSAISDILAMNGKPVQLLVNLGLSSKVSVERLNLLMSGVASACAEYGACLAGFRPTTSLTGLTISISVTGTATGTGPVPRGGARPADIICVTGDLGGALLGLHLLEREKRVLRSSGDQKPEFGNNDRVLQRQLKPAARLDIVEKLESLGVKPTSMTCTRDGLATSLLLICKASGTGCRVFENRIPLDQSTLKASAELNFNPLVAALNGGDDFELLFTLTVVDHEKIKPELLPGVTMIGYVTAKENGCFMISSREEEIEIKARGWGEKNV